MNKFIVSLFKVSLATLFLTSCGNENYSVNVYPGTQTVSVHMKCPSVGVGLITYPGYEYEDVERDIFDGIRYYAYDGNYQILVTMEFEDEYGNPKNGETVNVGSLNAAEVKRYASYHYFKGKTHLERAFPWNQE